MRRTPEQIQKSVVFALMMRELQTRFGGQMIGLFWVLFEPIANIVVFLMIRVVLRDRYAGVQMDPSVFLIVAMIPFFVFRNIWFRAAGAGAGNSGLFSYRQVKPLDAMIARSIIEAMIYAVIFVLLIGYFGWTGATVMPGRPLEYMGVVALLIIWGLALGLITAVLGHNRPAVQTFLRLLSMPLYILSGVIIPLSRFPATMHEFLLWNPLLHLVELSRWAYFPSYQVFRGANLEYPLSVGLVLFALGMVMYRVNRLKLIMRT
jgi:capsular polysaccharide transport system permease protein